jgi:26S proteasome regulatory subunit N8
MTGTTAAAAAEGANMEVDEEASSTTMEQQQPQAKMLDIDEVIIHPLVLLSAADHYHRVARGTRKRVVGVLLGQVHQGVVDATNSFAVPFEEDSRNPVRIASVGSLCSVFVSFRQH